MQILKPDLYRYLDFRSYLAEFYSANKASNPSFSFRFLAQQMKLQSPNYFKLIIDGERRFTEKYIVALERFLNLSEGEGAYLRLLIEFADAKSLGEKDLILATIRKSAKSIGIKELAGEEYGLYEEWHTLPLLELVTSPEFKGDAKQIAGKLRISERMVRKTLGHLEKNGFIARRKSGRFVKVFPNIDSKNEVANYYLQRYHVLNLQEAAKRVFQQKVEEREFSSLTFCCSPETMKLLKQRLKGFRAEVMELLSKPRGESEEVFQLNSQFFRVTEANHE